MHKFISILLYAYLMSTSISAMDGSSANQDPVAGIDYTKAFNQTGIQKKYAELMRQIGCSTNVYLEDSIDSSDGCQSNCEYTAIELSDEDINQLEHLANYNDECLAQLSKERRSAILRPARESASFMGLLGGGVILMSYLVPDSAAFGVSIAVINCLYHSRELIKSLGNWYDTRPHPVDRFEQIYAKNKCYIPHEIWKPIEDEFLKGRGNQFSQNQSLNFLEFTLGLTVHKQKHSLNSIDKRMVLNALSAKVDKFFKDYEPFENERDLFALKASIDDFVLGLIGGKERPRYIYLFGSKGLGKTHFARELNRWIAELLPSSTTYSEQEVRSPSELGGAPGVPGFMLGALRMQCCANTNGSVTLVDEAIWINDPSYLSDGLKVFEDSRLPLRVKYFGDGMDGKGIALNLPPMLNILAGNKDIKTEALKSRFDFVSFPKPTKKALMKHALGKIKKHPSAQHVNGLFEKETNGNNRVLNSRFKSELEEYIKNIDNFRDTETLVHSLVKKWAETQRTSNRM